MKFLFPAHPRATHLCLAVLSLALLAVVTDGVTTRAFAQSGPSFDCAKASTRSERAICGDARLARLDLDLSRAYAAAVAANPDIRDQQRRWLQVRDSCGQIVGCLASQMQRRIAELQELAANGGRAPTHEERATANADRNELARLQEAMRLLGLYDGVVDGLDGPRTQAAIAELLRRYTFAQPRMSVRELAEVAETEAGRRMVVTPSETAPVIAGLDRPLSEGVWSLHRANTRGFVGSGGTRIGDYTFSPIAGGVLLTRTDARKAVSAEFRAAADGEGFVRVGPPPSGPIDIIFTELEYHGRIFGADILRGRNQGYLIRLDERPELTPYGLADLKLNDICQRLGAMAASANAEIHAAMGNERVSRREDLDWNIRTNALRMGLFGPTSGFRETFGVELMDMPSDALAAIFQRLAGCAVWMTSTTPAQDIGLAILEPYNRNALAEVLGEVTYISGSSPPPSLKAGPGIIRSEVDRAAKLADTLRDRAREIVNSDASQGEKLQKMRQLSNMARTRMVPSQATTLLAAFTEAEGRIRSNILIGAAGDDTPRSETQLVHAALQDWLLANCGLATALAEMTEAERLTFALMQSPGTRSEDGYCVKYNLAFKTRVRIENVARVSCSDGAQKTCTLVMRRSCKTIHDPSFTTVRTNPLPEPLCALVDTLPMAVTGQFAAMSEGRWKAIAVTW